MARFTDLPTEIVQAILGLILPEDLENFAPTCKQVFLASSLALRDHRKLIRQYATLSNRGPEEEMRTEHYLRTIPSVLKNILDNPRVGRYVKKLHIGTLYKYHVNHVDGEDDSVGDENWKDFHEKIDMFEMAACQSHYLDTSGMTDHWGQIIAEGDEELLLALLLTELPNLDTLSIKWAPSWEENWLCQVLGRVPTAAIPILSNLRTVHLESGANEVYLDDLRLFSALPSLKWFSASGVVDEGDWEYYPLPNHHSNVTHLIMPRSHVGSKSLHEYLLSFPLLQSFEYEHVSSIRETYKPLDPFLLRSALLSQARTTLQKLSITGPLSQQLFIGSLVGFERLWEIHTTWSFLIPDSADLRCWPARILPASLCTLKLRDKSGRDQEEYADFVEGLTSAKGTTCPLLETFELAAQRVPEFQDLQRTCEDIGITFVIWSDPS